MWRKQGEIKLVARLTDNLPVLGVHFLKKIFLQRFCSSFYLFLFWFGLVYVAKDDPALLILLPLSFEFWDYRGIPQCPVYVALGIKLRALYTSSKYSTNWDAISALFPGRFFFVFQVDFKLQILLPQLLNHWFNRHTPSHPPFQSIFQTTIFAYKEKACCQNKQANKNALAWSQERHIVVSRRNVQGLIHSVYVSAWQIWCQGSAPGVVRMKWESKVRPHCKLSLKRKMSGANISTVTVRLPSPLSSVKSVAGLPLAALSLKSHSSQMWPAENTPSSFPWLLP